MWAAFFLAVIPLVWILGTVIPKGGHMLLESTWWTGNSAQHQLRRLRRRRRATPSRARSRWSASPRSSRCRSASSPPSTSSSTAAGRLARVDQLHRRHPHRHPLDRRRPVHLRRVGHDLRLRALRLRRGAGAGAADDPRHRALHRGDAQARAQRAARGGLRPRRAEVGDRRQGRAAAPRSRASSPACCSASPGSWARRRRC